MNPRLFPQSLAITFRNPLINHLVLSFSSPSSSLLLLHNRHQQIHAQTYDGFFSPYLNTNILRYSEEWSVATIDPFLLFCHIRNLRLSFLVLFSVLMASWKLTSPFIENCQYSWYLLLNSKLLFCDILFMSLKIQSWALSKLTSGSRQSSRMPSNSTLCNIISLILKLYIFHYISQAFCAFDVLFVMSLTIHWL